MHTDTCVVLFSGGTDSTCTAALCAEKFERVHLLTFFEHATSKSPKPSENVARLGRKYGPDKFIHRVISTDRLVKKISYERYLTNIFRFGFFMMSSPGFSSLSWHLRTIKYCLDHGIKNVYDGMTKELMHFPGHMTEVRQVFQELYASFNITFSSSVISWDVPPDQRFVDRLIVDRHGFVQAKNLEPAARTTGVWLFENGIFPHPNVKGSLFDHRMQHDCYPFVAYNIFVFWFASRIYSWSRIREIMKILFAEKSRIARTWLIANKQADLFAEEEPAT